MALVAAAGAAAAGDFAAGDFAAVEMVEQIIKTSCQPAPPGLR
jgi:hypothetical protein